ncbi:xanthine dehydrogenase family protein molybdopterin-binding subunit [Ornithinibacillus gellani]|uniref:xanthine dehydrogenase family protein molybdopterin-binding subunit n=1 Tax=Ornithinibacillus gellani TaxID=2293253 RepID=UPI000F49F574|nr:xanthine dehydrogenase family protein molybdopterin-binding subunit [Ornithinibacillus gellani]TQS74464.1 xanthine dehydrogenase family protein molybdopterin-binding subunit [Ornithinibacillus gellani]
MKQPFTYIGKDIKRIDLAEKAQGKVRYTDDTNIAGMLHAKLHTSTEAHANITEIDISKAWEIAGVHAIITGEDFPFPVGPMLADRPPLAIEKTRYYGEPIAIVVADTEQQAKRAAEQIQVTYEPLPIIQSPREAMKKDAITIHENLGSYKVQVEGVHAVPGTNIANHTKIRKGDIEQGWQQSEVMVESSFSFSPADHAALEPRVARVEILPNGKVMVTTSTQGPFYVKKLLSEFFQIDAGNIMVHTPFVGGAFGGKGTVQLEFLAYLASRATGGKLVRIANSREEDMVTSPVHIGLEATVKLGARSDGTLTAAHYEFLFDGGAYSDMGAGMSKAAAVDCTGPYKLEHVSCDSYCMYTNHPYATSFRGFGHPELTFVMERMMDLLAKKLNLDPIQLRLNNLIKPGDTTPTQVHLNASNIGDVRACLQQVKKSIQWDEGQRTKTTDGKIRTKGVAAFWKTSSTPSNATAGVLLTFNTDGSVNLNCAAVEIGQGTKTVLAQILAEKLQLDMNKIHVTIEVNTMYDPHQWKTVASSTTYLAGRAVIAAADDAIRQLLQIGSVALKCLPDDLAVGNGRIYLRDSPEYFIPIKDVATGYKYPNGNTVGGLIIGKGSHVVRHLTPIDPETGFGKPGPQWTVGAQAVEVEYDPTDCTYRILQAATALDAGKVINPIAARSQMRGGMYLGLSWASRETFVFDDQGKVLNPQFRTYDTLRLSEIPTYKVDFIETPLIDGPYGARGIGEYGVIGMAGALANSLSHAADAELTELPLIPELIWKTIKGEV